MQTNREPFERVVQANGAVVARVCRSVLGPHSDADDAWAETFLAALRAWPELPADANVTGWLVTIARRKAIDVLRAKQRHALPTDDLPEGESRHGRPEEAQLDLWSALGQLSERQQQCVVLHHIAGLPHAEVADVVGGTPAAVRRASADAIAILRGLLADHERTTP